MTLATAHAATGDDAYAKATKHPLASIILAALHKQDAETYHGTGSSDIGERALAVLADIDAAGFTILRAKSHRAAQERRRVAEALKDAAERDAERTRAWAREVCAEERRIRDRLTFVYGVAKAHGATDAELSGCEQCSRATCFCGNPGAPEVVHRAGACVPWKSVPSGLVQKDESR